MNLLDIITGLAARGGFGGDADLPPNATLTSGKLPMGGAEPLPAMAPAMPKPRPAEAPQGLPTDAITSIMPTDVQRAERGMPPIRQTSGGGAGGLLSVIAPDMTSRDRMRMTNALAGGLSGMNSDFKFGAFGKGMGGALKASNDFEDAEFKRSLDALDRVQKARAAGNDEEYKGALTDYYKTLTKAKASASAESGTTRPGRASPTSAVWNDPRFRFDKARRAVESANRAIDGDFRLKPEEREARKREESATIYQRYGLNPDGSAPNAPTSPVAAAKRAGKSGEISFDGDGTQAAPYKPTSKVDYDQIESGTYYIHPSTGQLKLKK